MSLLDQGALISLLEPERDRRQRSLAAQSKPVLIHRPTETLGIPQEDSGKLYETLRPQGAMFSDLVTLCKSSIYILIAPYRHQKRKRKSP